MLIQLTYASRSTNVLKPDDVRNILQTSQRNNSAAGVTGVLCLSHGIFLQQLEGDRRVVNRLYHRIQQDARHTDTMILDFSEIPCRRFGTWSMGLLSSVEENRQLFLKYSSSNEFNPFDMNTATLRAFFEEVLQNMRWLKMPD